MNIQIFKKYDIVQVKHQDTHFFFKKYFKTIYEAETNSKAIDLCLTYHIPIVFLYCNQDTIDTKESINTLKTYNPDIIIVVISYLKEAKKLLPLLSLDITDHFDATKDMTKTKEVLANIYKRLKNIDNSIRFLQEHYCFNRDKYMLCNESMKEIKLSKKEKILLGLLASKNNYLTIEELEYTLWPNDYYNENCSHRLKSLIYRLKKKLPPHSIISNYEIGYKLVHV